MLDMTVVHMIQAYIYVCVSSSYSCICRFSQRLCFFICLAYFVFLALSVLGFVSPALVKRLAGKSISVVTHFLSSETSPYIQ